MITGASGSPRTGDWHWLGVDEEVSDTASGKTWISAAAPCGVNAAKSVTLHNNEPAKAAATVIATATLIVNLRKLPVEVGE